MVTGTGRGARLQACNRQEVLTVVSRGWNDEDESRGPARPQARVADLAFALYGHALPADHAHALSQAIAKLLPWFTHAPQVGLHLVHGAESGNGWQRPESAGALVYLARRTRLTLRLPDARLHDARVLTGVTLDIGGHALAVGEAGVRPLMPSGTLYARHVVDEQGEEEAFLEQVSQALDTLGIGRGRVMCGKTRRLDLPGAPLVTRSVLVAGLSRPDSLFVQAAGIGPGRILGCGLFVPYKSPANAAGSVDEP